MTSGSLVNGPGFRDITYKANGVPTAINQTGSTGSRVWSGQDAPKVSRSADIDYVEWHALDKRGRWRLRRTKLRRKSQSSDAGKKVPHPYSVSWVSDIRPLCTFKRSRKAKSNGAVTVTTYTDYVTRTSSGDLLPPAPVPFDANDQIKLVNKIVDRWRGDGGFNPSLFAAELPMAVKLVGDTAVKLARAYHLFRKGDIVGAAKTLPYSRTVKGRAATKRAVAGNNWLELQYGWLPLIDDLKSAGDMIYYHCTQPSPITRVSARRSKELLLDAFYKTKSGTPLDAFSGTKRQIIAYLRVPPSNLGLSGLLDPELVAWELVPFSFVADWIAPIGPMLEARAASAKMVGTFVTTDTSRRSFSGYQERAFDTLNWVDTFSVIGGEACSAEITSIVRSVSTTLSVPMPVVKPLDKVASLGHCLNGLALLTGILTGANLSKAQRKLLT